MGSLRGRATQHTGEPTACTRTDGNGCAVPNGRANVDAITHCRTNSDASQAASNKGA